MQTKVTNKQIFYDEDECISDAELNAGCLVFLIICTIGIFAGVYTIIHLFR